MRKYLWRTGIAKNEIVDLQYTANIGDSIENLHYGDRLDYYGTIAVITFTNSCFEKRNCLANALDCSYSNINELPLAARGLPVTRSFDKTFKSDEVFCPNDEYSAIVTLLEC